MQAINPYLVFNGNAEKVFTFYQTVFGGEMMLVRFRDMAGGADMPEAAGSLIAHVALPLNGTDQLLMGSDCPPGVTVDIPTQPNYSVCLSVSDAPEAERLYNALAADGTVTMQLGKTEFAEQFAMVTDKYGIPWIIDYSPGD